MNAAINNCRVEAIGDAHIKLEDLANSESGIVLVHALKYSPNDLSITRVPISPDRPISDLNWKDVGSVSVEVRTLAYQRKGG